MICTIVGARPNFIKMAPIIDEIKKRGQQQVFVHTGQHYDEKLSGVFFKQLKMPEPDVYLNVGSASHAVQTAMIMINFEKVCLEYCPQLIIIAGDVNSTIACALVAAKLNIPVAHVESGLRSFDREMPEEINRILTDHISELLFTSELSGKENLAKEGIPQEKIHFVGNTMIDSLENHIDAALQRKPWEDYGFHPGHYGIITLHRPSNVDNVPKIQEWVEAFNEIGNDMPFIFPIHPRTLHNGKGLWEQLRNINISEPLPYLEFLGLLAKSNVVITDSGGIQEETTALSIPCLTIRTSTERPVTITRGTNTLVKPEKEALIEAYYNRPPLSNVKRPELWDGKAAPRIVAIVENWLRGISK